MMGVMTMLPGARLTGIVTQVAGVQDDVLAPDMVHSDIKSGKMRAATATRRDGDWITLMGFGLARGVDIYFLNHVVHQWLAGRPPFAAKTLCWDSERPALLGEPVLKALVENAADLFPFADAFALFTG